MKSKNYFKLRKQLCKTICFPTIILLILLTSYYYFYSNEGSQHAFVFSKEKDTNRKLPPILVWNSKCVRQPLEVGIDRGFPGYPNLSPNFKCPFNCTFTSDRQIEINASTIIFFLHELCPMDGLPINRKEDQNYMMYTVESPVNTMHYYDRKLMTNKWFNSSATYRLDSSVIMPYDFLTKIKPETPVEEIWTEEEILAKIKNKTKLAFQAVSHCNAESGRDNLSNKIKELMSIDFVGGCDGIECNGECGERELNKHFFYLAFENSICQHYVTEKFWFALRALTVPVVISRSVFTGMDVPSNAFIAVDDFLSVNEFVEHLKALRYDKEKYLKHFEWTKTYTKKRFGTDYSPLCKICELATKHFVEKKKSIINLNEFWNEENCKNDTVTKMIGKR